MTRTTEGTPHRPAGWSMRHAGWAVLLWIVALAAVVVGSGLIGDRYRNDNSLPGTDSQRVMDLLRDHQADTESVQLVFFADQGLAADKARIAEVTRVVGTLPHVAQVSDPFQGQGSIAPDQKTGYATVELDVAAADMPAEDVRAVLERARRAAGDSLRVELGGDLARSAFESEGGAAEGAGMLAALVILVFLFGSLLAATLPLLTAVFAVGITIGLLVLGSRVFTVPEYTAPVMMLVGLGVGIDYALLIFSRYRTELLAGRDRPAAATIALDTAGRSVLFAGCTVVIALLGLLALGLGALQGVALGVTLTVLLTMVAAVTLLPALLALFGRRIERSVRRHAAKKKHVHGDGWRRIAMLVQRRPWAPLLLGTAALAALSVPALELRLGFADAGTDDPAKTSRQAYDLLASGFGPGVNGPLVVVTEGDPAAAAAAGRELAGDPGIAAVTPPRTLPDGKVSTVLVFPRSAPQDEGTGQLVERLRDTTLPALERQTSANYLVAGSTAAATDFAAAVSKRLPIFVLVVVGLSALLLMAVFRSVLIPVKAAILNLLSIGASLGVITMVFQQGWFGAQPGPIEAFVPVMIFAIVFGLSMDYEVFLISRIHEEWRRTGDPLGAVREGLAHTGSVITAAAAIMIVVFGAFLLSPDRMLNQFGLGLAVAVLLDALVIRCLIVPAVLRLLGRTAWWLPKTLDRLLPTISVDRKRPERPAGVLAGTANRRSDMSTNSTSD